MKIECSLSTLDIRNVNRKLDSNKAHSDYMISICMFKKFACYL